LRAALKAEDPKARTPWRCCFFLEDFVAGNYLDILDEIGHQGFVRVGWSKNEEI
jgi:hypothetical protein